MFLLDSRQIFNILASISFQIAQCRFSDNRDRLKEIHIRHQCRKYSFMLIKKTCMKSAKNTKNKIKIKAQLYLSGYLVHVCLSLVNADFMVPQ